MAGGDGDAGGPWIVLGLGNPDDEYGNTRHNAGAMVVALLAERAGAKLKRSRNRAQVAEVRDGDTRVVLARPSSYVNESGGPASLLARWYKTPVERIIVVHDEIDLAYGKLQVRRDGGTAGHNGLKDIAKALGSPDFLRVRIGVGRPPAARTRPTTSWSRSPSATPRTSPSWSSGPPTPPWTWSTCPWSAPRTATTTSG